MKLLLFSSRLLHLFALYFFTICGLVSMLFLILIRLNTEKVERVKEDKSIYKANVVLVTIIIISIIIVVTLLKWP